MVTLGAAKHRVGLRSRAAIAGPVSPALNFHSFHDAPAVLAPLDLALSAGIPGVNEIFPSPDLLRTHSLRKRLACARPFSTREIRALIRYQKLDLSIVTIGDGIVPASPNDATSYARYAWTRDMAIVACAAQWTGNTIDAYRMIRTLANFYASQDQRERMVTKHFDPDAPQSFRDLRGLPHIRMSISDQGELQATPESDQWGHHQLDALGYFLWTTFRFANQGRFHMRALSADLVEKNGWNAVESPFVVAAKYLCHVKFWDQEDLGPWEERLGRKRASSVGVCLAALMEMRKFIAMHGFQDMAVAPNQDGTSGVPEFRRMLDHAISQARGAIDERISAVAGSLAVETDSQGVPGHDAALALLLYPVDLELTPEQQVNVLRTVYAQMGEVGFRRYAGDAYVGMDYHLTGHPHLMADTSQPGYREAQWCIFDPTIAAYFFRRYALSNGTDREGFFYGMAHLRRAISQVTSAEHSFFLASAQRQVQVERGSMPEAYFFSTDRAASGACPWLPNSNSPLNWSTAALALALERAAVAAEIFEAQDR